MQNFLITVILFSLSLSADVKSLSGRINFDVNNDDQIELSLTSDGLGIGTLVPQANLHTLGNSIIHDSLSVGSSDLGSSNFHISGTYSVSHESASNNITLSDQSTVFIDSSSDNIFLYLPYADNVAGRMYTIKKTSEQNEVRVIAKNGYIDHKSMIVLDSSLDATPSLTVISSQSNWYILTSTAENFQEIASDNLVAWYKLDEPAGSSLAYDSVSETFNGTISNLPSANIGVDGILNKAVHFNGNGQITLPDLGMDSIEGSVAMWINYTSDFGELGILAHASETDSGDGFGGQNEWHLDIQTNQKLEFFIEGPTEIKFYDANTINANQWYHLVATWNSANTAKLFRDGVEVGSETSHHALFDFGSQIILGKPASDKRQYEGLMDEVRLYDKALTEDEVLLLYQSTIQN